MNENMNVLDTGSRAGMTSSVRLVGQGVNLVLFFCHVLVQVCFLFFSKKKIKVSLVQV